MTTESAADPASVISERRRRCPTWTPSKTPIVRRRGRSRGGRRCEQVRPGQDCHVSMSVPGVPPPSLDAAPAVTAAVSGNAARYFKPDPFFWMTARSRSSWENAPKVPSPKGASSKSNGESRMPLLTGAAHSAFTTSLPSVGTALKNATRGKDVPARVEEVGGSRIFHQESSDADPPKARDMCARPEPCRHVAGKGADVGTLGARNPEARFRRPVVEDFQGLDRNGARRQLDALTPAGSL